MGRTGLLQTSCELCCAVLCAAVQIDVRVLRCALRWNGTGEGKWVLWDGLGCCRPAVSRAVLCTW